VSTDPANPRDALPQPDEPPRDQTPSAAISGDGWSVTAPPTAVDDGGVFSDTLTADAADPQSSDQSPGAAEYNRRAKQGVKLMLGRQVFIQVFTFAGGIVLARTLTPEIFGVFGIATFFIHTLALFGDFGLAPSLVQRKDELTEKDLQVAFTLQQVLLTLVAVAVWLGAPYFLLIYPDLGGSEITWLIRVMAVTLFLQSWRSMSVLQMERHLNFKRIAWIEIVEALSYQALAVGLAVAGFGVWSLVWATLTRAVLGTGLAFAASPWRVRLAWDYGKAKEILRFGLPFQAGSILNSAGGWVTPLLVGTLIGPAGVGFLTWAGSNGRKPMLLLHNISRVSFPHFSRLQNNPEALVDSYERYLTIPLFLCGLWVSTIAVSADELVPIIYSDKWAPGVLALQLFAGFLALQAATLMTGTLLRSTGRVTCATCITAITSVLQIMVAIPLVWPLGFVAVPIGMICAFSFKYIAFSLASPPGVFATSAGILIKAVVGIVIAVPLARYLSATIDNPLWCGLTGVVLVTSLYGLCMAWLAPRWIKQRVRREVRLYRERTWAGVQFLRKVSA